MLKDLYYVDILSREFNRVMLFITMLHVKPEGGSSDFVRFEYRLDFASDHNMQMMSNLLIYRNKSIPVWLKVDNPDYGGWKKSEHRALIREYIQRMVYVGMGRVVSWEVVNEPLVMNKYYRYQILGKDYIALAFSYALQTDLNAHQMIDYHFGYSDVSQSKINAMLDLVKWIRRQGTLFHTVETEMHLDSRFSRPAYANEFLYFLTRPQEIGIDVMITELDVCQGPPGYLLNLFEEQKEVYRSVLSIYPECPYCKGLFA
jgi:GH35 family endo-1,4-beta-xylanase